MESKDFFEDMFFIFIFILMKKYYKIDIKIGNRKIFMKSFSLTGTMKFI